MATAESIAIRNEGALRRLNENVGKISEHVAVAPPDIPAFYRNANELPTMQLEALAAWAESVVHALEARSEANVQTKNT